MSVSFIDEVFKDIDHIISKENELVLLQNIEDKGILNMILKLELQSNKLNIIYPDNIIDLILSNINEFKFTLKYVYEKGNKFITKKSITEIDKIKFHLNKYTQQNKMVNDIVDWVKTIDDFFDFSNIIDINIEEQPLTIDKFIPRENQKEAFELLEKNGLETGIHCQATGCGKTFIILKYIDYCIQNIKNPKIILFTERVNILVDLFDFKNNEPNYEKINKWQELGIADLTKLNIINRVTVKKKWHDELINSNKPTLLVINRAYLTRKSFYSKIKKKHLSLILHDECHNTSSKMCNEFLKYCKELKVPIVGFSATPLRTGKDDLKKLKEIYPTDNNGVKLLTNYNMIYAIQKNLILPPIFHWYELPKVTKNDKNKVLNDEADIVIQLLGNIIDKLPNKKLVAWCGKIDMARQWKKIFEKKCGPTNLKNFKFYIDTSQNTNSDYNIFKNCNGNAILFCATKHREGSDIKKLDGCLFLDRVKNRGCIPFIQSIGRVLRIDNTNENKKNGVIIDCIYQEDKQYNSEFVDKIFNYYFALENITGIITDNKTSNERYQEMKDIIKFDKHKITINFGKNNMKIYLNSIKWSNIESQFDTILQKKIKLSSKDNFNHKAQILKHKFNFNEKTDFYKEYNKISQNDKNKYNLPNINSDDYLLLFNKQTWFDFLNITHNFYSNIGTLKKALNKLSISKEDPEKLWNEYCKLDERIPPYPQYVYDNFKYNDFIEIKSNNFSFI